MKRGCGLAFAALLALPSPTSAQVLAGRVVDELRETPVAGAALQLLNRRGEIRAEVEADADGRFILPAPEPGEYIVLVTRLGYRTTRFPLLDLSEERTHRVDFVLQPLPVGLEGFEVTVDVVAKAEKDLELAGISPRDLGRRWISPEDVEAIEIKRDVGTVLEWQGIGGMRVIRPENLVPGSDDLGMCVSMVRGRTAGGMGRCALPVIDGVPVTNDYLLNLDPLNVEAMAVLQPLEAVILYGKRGEAGAVMVWTKRGGRR